MTRGPSSLQKIIVEVVAVGVPVDDVLRIVVVMVSSDYKVESRVIARWSVLIQKCFADFSVIFQDIGGKRNCCRT